MKLNESVGGGRLRGVVVDALLGAIVTPIAIVVAYLFGLTASAVLHRRTEILPSNKKSRFAVIIPAHNEASTIGVGLASLAALNYPKDRFTVHLVADNCSDGTARV